jgi:tetratricopeptide (TPR) repeat protein
LALGAILWGTHATQQGFDASRRRELSRRLARALDDDEWEPAAQLIRQGADPRTRDSEGKTSLVQALDAGDVPVTRMILTASQDDLLMVEHELGGQATPTANSLDQLPERETTLAEAVCGSGSGLVNGWLGLAQLRQRQGKYRQAAEAFRSAFGLDPSCLAARSGAERADAAADAARRIAALLPNRTSGLQVEQVGTWRGAGLWAVLCAERAQIDQIPQIEGARVGLFTRDARGMHLLGALHGLRNTNEATYNYAGMWVRDLTRDGVPEVAVQFTSFGGGYDAPASLEILAVAEGKLRPVLQLDGVASTWIEDVDGDGAFEAGTTYRIGDELASVERPYWKDIYAFDGHRYTLANRRYPRKFREWRETLEAFRARYPNDASIRDYLGRTYEILGRPGEAAASYERAESVLIPQLRQAHLEAEQLAELRVRTQTLSKRLRSVREKRTRHSGHTDGLPL